MTGTQWRSDETIGGTYPGLYCAGQCAARTASWATSCGFTVESLCNEAPTNSPTQAPTCGTYCEGDVDYNCPAGYRTITNAEVCTAAGVALGYQLHGQAKMWRPDLANSKCVSNGAKYWFSTHGANNNRF